MMYLDISVQSFSGAFTIKAKTFNLKTAIVFKAPQADLTTIRLLGSTDDLTMFLRTRFAENFVQMHVAAIKEATSSIANPLAIKNQALRENRLGVVLT